MAVQRGNAMAVLGGFTRTERAHAVGEESRAGKARRRGSLVRPITSAGGSMPPANKMNRAKGCGGVSGL